MRRSSREFRAGTFELEGRALLSGARVMAPVIVPPAASVMGSDPIAPPKAVNVHLKWVSVYPSILLEQGIVLTFNKPMNPVAASNVNNYAVTLVNHDHHITNHFFGLSHTTSSTVSTRLLTIQSAQYDPATQSVTLIPDYQSKGHSRVTFGAQTVKLVSRAKPSFRRGQSSDGSQGLTDLEGNPVNAGTTPGKVELRLSRLINSGSANSFFSIGTI